MGDRKVISDFITDNETRSFYALDRRMLQAHREGHHDHAESTARQLLEYAELPLLIDENFVNL